MKDNIYWKMTKESWKKDKFSTISFTAFVSISITMISLTVMLFINLTTAIDHLMDIAKTPDFFQMHTGDIDKNKLQDFALNKEEVADYQITRFLNLDNSTLKLGEKSLLDSTQDNGISVQGDRFDYMVGLDNELPDVYPGEVYVPVCYESMYQVKIGDEMKIGNKKLTVAGFIRDSQMNSMMASSKRFLVCKRDYENLKSLGSEEYFIEFLLVEDADTNAFKTAYEEANLPMNGPAITRPLIKMMNTLSDGMMIMIILLISVLVLLISLVCIRYMLLTRVICESREVGLLKAIGISRKNIRNIFLRRYSWLIFIGAGLGIGASLCLFRPLSLQMQKLYGVSVNILSKYLYAILSAVFVGGFIILFVFKILRKLNEMTALRALTARIDGVKKNNSMLSIMIVITIAVFLMMIPANLHSTLSSPKFVTYMGIGNAEIRMDMHQGKNGDKEFEKIGKLLSKDADIKEYVLYQTSLMPVRLDNGITLNMLVEQGNHQCFPVMYNSGCAPKHEKEVALSYLLAQELELYPGDQILIKLAGQYQKCTITGIYSDITNGGKTAKLFTDHLKNEKDVMWRIAYVTLTENANRDGFIDKYIDKGVEVVDIALQVQETYGSTLDQIKNAAILVKIVVSVIILLVIMMFVRMKIANQRYMISIKKALGFKSLDIQKSFWKLSVPYIFAGIILGTTGGCFLGEKICAVALKSLGAVSFRFTFDIYSIVLNMLIGGCVSIGAVYLGSYGIKNIKAVECCRERE